MRGEKEFFYHFLYVFLIFIAVLIGFAVSFFYQFVICTKGIEQIDTSGFVKPIRFKLYGTGPETISGRVAFYDKRGREISVVERSWNGVELNLDFSSAEFGSKKILFPYRIYTENTSAYGTEIYRYYIQNNVCNIYSDVGDTDKEKSIMFRLSSFALSKIKNPFAVSNSKTYKVKLSSYSTGIEYAIYVDDRGCFFVLAD